MPSDIGNGAPLLKRLLDTIGLDRAIGYTVLARGWRTLAGLGTVLLISRYLSPDEQGYYYTFSSLVALQIVFELGFSFVILQMASHERAHLTIDSDLKVSGDAISHARLASIFQKSVHWYAVASVGMVVTLIPIGMYFFAAHQQGSRPVAWMIPWWSAVLSSTLNFLLDPVLAFFEGCGYVADVASVRFVQAIVGTGLAWLSLVAGYGLYAPAMVMAGTACTAIVWLFGRRRFLWALLTLDAQDHRVHWWQEVWPFQWRIAISWLCSYIISQIFTPVLFALKGAAAAGQMGMSLSLGTALQAIAISWINTKSAPFGAMIARREFGLLDRIFFKSVKQAMAVHAVGALLMWLGVLLIQRMDPRLAQRLLDPLPLAALLLTTNINVAVFALALYTRAHKQEKFLVNSVVTAALTGTSTFVLGRFWGADGMLAGYLAIVVCVSLGMGIWTFTKYRRLWHGPGSTASPPRSSR